MLRLPDVSTLKGKRDRAMLSVLAVACAAVRPPGSMPKIFSSAMAAGLSRIYWESTAAFEPCPCR